MRDPQHRLGSGVHAPLPQDVTIRAATAADCFDIGPRLRVEDQREVEAATGIAPAFALRLGLRPSASVVEWRGRPVAIFGCDRFDAITGVPWLLTTPEIIEQGPLLKAFLRSARSVVEGWNETFPLLTNLTDARNAAHHRLLRWLGFTFLSCRPHGPAGLPFIEFIRVAHV